MRFLPSSNRTCSESDHKTETNSVCRFVQGDCTCSESDHETETNCVCRFVPGDCTCSESDHETETNCVCRFVQGDCTFSEIDHETETNSVFRFVQGDCTCSEIDHKTETNCVRFDPDNASTPRNIFLAIGSVTKQSRPITCCCEVATNDQACSTERKPAIFNVIEV